MSFSEVDKICQSITDTHLIPALSITIGYKDEVVFSKAYGEIYEKKKRIDQDTLFDIASLTKLLSGICFMQLVERKVISLSSPVCEVFPELSRTISIVRNGIEVDSFSGSLITWKHVLTHTSGIGWTRPKTRPSLPELCNGIDAIFDLPYLYAPGEHIVYSDIPIILLGKAVEKIVGIPLDELIQKAVCNPLGLRHTKYLRRSSLAPVAEDVVPTEYDEIFRKKRIWAEVHDENAYLLDGVSAHAGVFSTSNDLCKLAMHYNGCLHQDGILNTVTVADMIKQHAKDADDRRGLIWQLSGVTEDAYTASLSSQSYGHSGFTGCFLWNDPIRQLSIVVLSNDVYNGRDKRILWKWRKKIIQSIVESL